MPQAHRDACCLLGSWAGRVLLNGIDYWLAPVTVRYLWLQSVGTQLPGVSVCLPWTRVPLPGLALPYPPPPPCRALQGEGLHAHQVPVTGDSVGSELRSVHLTPTATKHTEA